MTVPSSKPEEAGVLWHIAISRKTGQFLHRIQISLIDAKLANERHLKECSGTEYHLEVDAIKYLPSTHPLEFNPVYKLVDGEWVLEPDKPDDT